MGIRPAVPEDLHLLVDVYRQAREIMLSCGNVNQWEEGHPSEDMIREDISRGYCQVIEDGGEIVGAFAFIPGIDPTYGVIENGEWIEDTLPYATIHRLASTKDSKGVANACFDWCWAQIHNLRVDTHADNVIMRHCIEKAGFRYCGIIHLINGDPRLAFQKIETNGSIQHP